MKNTNLNKICELINQNLSINGTILFNSLFNLPVGFEGKIVPNKTLGDLQINVFLKEENSLFLTLSLGETGNFYELNLSPLLCDIYKTCITSQHKKREAELKKLSSIILTPTGKIKNNIKEHHITRHKELVSLSQLSVEDELSDIQKHVCFTQNFLSNSQLFNLLKGFNFSLYIEKNGVFEKQELEKTPEQIDTFTTFVEENTVLYQGNYSCYYRTSEEEYEEEQVEFNFSQKIFVLEELTEAIYYRLINSVNDILSQYGL